MIVSNLTSGDGAGAYQVNLNNCTLAFNHAAPTSVSYGARGGGAAFANLTNCIITRNLVDRAARVARISCNLRNCAITRNSSSQYGSGASGGTLVNCTVSGNTSGVYNGYAGAVANASLTDCIVYGNFVAGTGSTQPNYYNSTMAYSDSDPLPAGVGNIDAHPQLLPDGYHVGPSSRCRGAGASVVFGTDIDGQPWANPPSMGCDEWQPQAVIGGQPQFRSLPARGC